jgi:single-strand DNA-binding protein
MMNRVILVGRLTKDPELRYTPNGVPVATFTLAVNRTFTNQQGEREADFLNCVVWRKPAENVAMGILKSAPLLDGQTGRFTKFISVTLSESSLELSYKTYM